MTSTTARIFEIADELDAAGQNPTLASVRKALGGGSFTTISQAGQAGVFDPMFSSMRRITIGEAGAVRARRLAVVTVKKGDTQESLARRMAYDDRPLDRLRVLNALSAQSALVPGAKIKLIVY